MFEGLKNIAVYRGSWQRGARKVSRWAFPYERGTAVGEEKDRGGSGVGALTLQDFPSLGMNECLGSCHLLEVFKFFGLF